ncbi:MAG TPA: DNA polymerase/3'-5' exonuclease PolX [Chloroflexia bacterium]|nr:DNA polymerase/3'-5' exonuclease PolX [Chloroflexia bacterium]
MPEPAKEAAEFTNATFARLFNDIAAMMELKGESPFKVRAYRTAADTFANLAEDIKRVWREGRVDELPGVGKAITEKVDEMMTTGKLRFYDRLQAEVPPSLIALVDIPHLGPKTAMLIYKTLGIQGIADLEKAIADGRIYRVPGLGKKTVVNIQEGLEALQRRSADKRELLGTALPVVRQLISSLKQQCPGIDKIEMAGSGRRWRATVGDIDLLATASNPEAVIDCFVTLPIIGMVETRGENKATIRLHNGLQVDLYVMDPQYYYSLLHHFTSGRQHNIKLRDRAIRMGLKINEYGIQRENGERIPINSEEDIYRALNLQYIPPELREDRGEIEAAARNALPELVKITDIKGDLHCHSTWSDGAESILDMARAAKARGYRYMAITDHSQSLTIAKGLTIERLHAQRREIEEAQRVVGGDFRIFHGTEMEIKLDGTLDFPDEILAWLDIVVASIHSGLRQPGEQVTQRALNAVRNPHVDILGHPTGRLINQREPSAMDVSAVIKEAAQTGTALEINAAPDRLDLDDIYVKEAMEEGCLLSVDTDAHHRDNYSLLEYGIGIARRGWATPDRILTTWEPDRLEAWLQSRGK